MLTCVHEPGFTNSTRGAQADDDRTCLVNLLLYSLPDPHCSATIASSCLALICTPTRIAFPTRRGILLLVVHYCICLIWRVCRRGISGRLGRLREVCRQEPCQMHAEQDSVERIGGCNGR